MKRSYIIVVAIIIAAVMAYGGCDTEKTKVLNVRDVQIEPKAYQGTVTIAGIVAYVSPGNPKEFGLIDVADAQSNKPEGQIFCLPVISKGRVPKRGEAVKVTGQFAGKGIYFVATKVRSYEP
ncbi:MAG: hypothetical protein EG828_10305 [Deltaproteobacteria bacterium]|nr:hypothetical protein [Deltaproteobacteria bacterium]